MSHSGLKLVAIVSVAILVCCSCSPRGDSSKTHLVLTGSSTVAPLAGEIAKRFELSHPEVRVDVQTGGSSRGVADARRALADIGMVSRDLKPDEQDLRSFTIARDGICIIVHQDNPVTSLSNEHIIAIYTGDIENWSEVGGVDAEITVVNKAAGRSTLELFLGFFKLENSDIKADVVIGDNEQGIKTVVGNVNSIGYVSIGTAEYDHSRGVAIQLLPLSDVPATIENVSNATFPLSRPLNLVTKSEPYGLVKEFIEFASSVEVHDIVKEQYFVPLTE